jgi:putative ABC transport system substrate-binding protein
MKSQRRNLVVATSTLLALPSISFSQSAKHYRIGVLALEETRVQEPIWDAFLTEMARLGYVQGRNLTIERRFSARDGRNLESLAVELAGLKIDLLYAAGGTPSVQAAKMATSDIPIVMLTSAEPVRDSLVASLSHPGGNVTGNAIFGLELLIKRLQIIAEIMGNPGHIAYLGSRRSTFMRHFDEYRIALASAAQALGTELHIFVVESINDLESVFAAIERQRVDALVLDNPAIFFVHLERIAALVSRHRLPAIGDGRAFADAGLLASYGTDYLDLARKSARYVDRILKGSKPSDLPVELATKFEMIINLKTAEALGLNIPHSMRVRANEVIR